MTAITFHDGAFFASSVSPEDGTRLLELGWRRHARDLQLWWTRSPYLAAPLYSFCDQAAKSNLVPYAWNYATSFAKKPLEGTGCDAIRLPAGSAPYPFQIAGVQRAMMRERLIIGDEMGLGKTVQALAVMNLVRPLRTVIGCPTFLTRNWAHECDLWLVDPQPIVILDGAKKSLPESGIVILPYSRGHTFVDQIKAGPPIDMLIMDEAHYLKEPTSRRTKAWLGPEGLARKAKRVIALTGTPMPNNPLELYGLIEVLAPELVAGVSREKFKETYCTSIEMNLKITLKKSKREIQRPTEKIVAKGKSILNAELRASGLLVRRQKSEVLTQLPPKNIYFVHMGVDAKIESLVKEEADLYDQLQMRILTAQELIKIRGHVETVRTELGILKAPQIAAYVKYLFDEGEDRVVCFMLHRRPIEIIKEAFDKTGIDAYVLTGSESPKVRQARVDLFQGPGGRRLLIGQTTASGVGLNMTSARYGVIGELAWVPAWNEQAMDRLHRITQTRQVEIPILCYPHSCEENVIRTGARKSLDAREVLDKNLSNLLDINPATVLIAAE